jgi:hypothetical protein
VSGGDLDRVGTDRPRRRHPAAPGSAVGALSGTGRFTIPVSTTEQGRGTPTQLKQRALKLQQAVSELEVNQNQSPMSTSPRATTASHLEQVFSEGCRRLANPAITGRALFPGRRPTPQAATATRPPFDLPLGCKTATMSIAFRLRPAATADKELGKPYPRIPFCINDKLPAQSIDLLMETPNDTSWFDAEIKAALQKLPPKKLSPATIVSFAVVVLSLGSIANHAWQVRSIHKVLGTSLQDAELQLNRKLPFVLKRELTLADAMLTQFELACADVISIFLSDHIVTNGDSVYLASLYRDMVRADEFEIVTVRVVSVPDGATGRSFTDQFIAPDLRAFPCEFTSLRKKARIMTHWAKKIGATVRLIV